jgi:hypothetical protein
MRGGLAYCLLHYELLFSHDGYCAGVQLEAAFRAADPSAQYYSGGGGGVQKGRPRKRKLSSAVETADMPITMRLPTSALGECHSRCSVVVKAECYKPEGRGFETWYGDFLNLHNPSGRTRPWSSLSL